jgi:hypothetical protein
MADRRDYFFRQKVTEAELDIGFDGLEQADFNQLVDWGFRGVTVGMGVVEHSPQGVSVDVAAGTAYDQLGRRIRVPALQNPDVSVDLNGVTTAVASGGNEKIVSVFAKFKRALSDPRTDGNNETVFFVRDEDFEFVIRQGAEATAGTAVAPALQSDEILLADITRTFGDTTIADADIDLVTRRENLQLGQASPQIMKLLSDIVLSGSLTAGAISVSGAVTLSAAASILLAAGATLSINPADDFKYSAGRSITRVLNLFRAAAEDNTGSAPEWLPAPGTRWWRSDSNAGQLMVPLELPDGITDFNVDVLVLPGAARAPASRVSARVVRSTPNFTTPAVPGSTSVIAGVEDDGTAAWQVIALASGGAVAKGDMFFLEITSGSDGATNPDAVGGVRVTYTQTDFKPEHGG